MGTTDSRLHAGYLLFGRLGWDVLGSRQVRLTLNSAWMQSVLVILGVLMTIFLVDLGVPLCTAQYPVNVQCIGLSHTLIAKGNPRFESTVCRI